MPNLNAESCPECGLFLGTTSEPEGGAPIAPLAEPDQVHSARTAVLYIFACAQLAASLGFGMVFSQVFWVGPFGALLLLVFVPVSIGLFFRQWWAWGASVVGYVGLTLLTLPAWHEPSMALFGMVPALAVAVLVFCLPAFRR